MSRATRLADHIERTVTGPMWHGPALSENLEGVREDQARAHPLPDAHSIWELVLHITVWCDIARHRAAAPGGNGGRRSGPRTGLSDTAVRPAVRVSLRMGARERTDGREPSPARGRCQTAGR